jgi:hypothetical protein
MTRDLFLIILGMALAATFGVAFPKTYDEKKWERIEQNRTMRRAIEQRYESCMNSCREECNDMLKTT